MSFQFQQIVVCALFHDAAVVHYDNVVGMPDGAQPVGNDDGRAPLEDVSDVAHDFIFVLGVKRVGGFVQKEIFGFLVDDACQQYPLPLSLAQGQAFVANLCGVTMWKASDKRL